MLLVSVKLNGEGFSNITQVYSIFEYISKIASPINILSDVKYVYIYNELKALLM